METRREDIPDWDSFNYVNFIVAVELEFGVKFKVADIESFPNVGSIVKETTKILAYETAERFSGPSIRSGLCRRRDVEPRPQAIDGRSP